MLKVGAKAKIKVNGRVWRSQDAPIYVVTQHVEGKQWRLQDMSNGQCVDESEDNIAPLRKSRKTPASSSSVGVDKEDEPEICFENHDGSDCVKSVKADNLKLKRRERTGNSRATKIKSKRAMGKEHEKLAISMLLNSGYNLIEQAKTSLIYNKKGDVVASRREDLFGVIDLQAMKNDSRPLWIQVTTKGQMSCRRKKIETRRINGKIFLASVPHDFIFVEVWGRKDCSYCCGGGFPFLRDRWVPATGESPCRWQRVLERL
jgi:hypothetical protein